MPAIAFGSCLATKIICSSPGAVAKSKPGNVPGA
eukprot:CAMPEP_0115585044 /NCGR_PEP_ID=MMETSP0272-20121206/6994_1 /TAXON_ID=71861 /ORGANISM="Scrippsiella trochoidea, Strain CCMP3099" /LENGTH=33 /DNA_ID= /DNA_START= /DNA_END= /DNA_ORIENTATION=